MYRVVSEMLSTSKSEEAVKVSIPRQLHMAVLKVQVDNNMDWGDACAKAAELINANSEEFKKAVQREAQRIYNSQFMGQLNKTQDNIRKIAFQGGLGQARMDEDNFHVPCSICRKPMQFSDRDKNWESGTKPALYEAFGKWHHTSCPSS